MEHLHTLPAAELVSRMQHGKLRAETLTRHYLDRIEAYSSLNAVAVTDPTAIEQARYLDAQGDRSLPLFGLPVLVKDNIDVRGLPTTAGSAALLDNVAAADAPVIRNLRKNGAVILGKTNMTEFANYTTRNMPNGFSSAFGQVKHAYGPHQDPGGSSTGSAVAVSAMLCAAAIGTDTSFSIVGCAAQNGVCGMKPAHGTLSAKGIVPIAYSLDSAGPIARTFDDALLLLRGMMDQPFAPGRRRIAPRSPHRRKHGRTRADTRCAVSPLRQFTVPSQRGRCADG